MVGAIYALALFALPHLHPHHPHADRPQAPRTATRLDRHVYRVGRWWLAVEHDPFAAKTTCHLGSLDHARVDHARLVWELGPKVDTTHAVLRIDGGAPIPQDERLLPASANLENPSDGRVVVPVTALAGARRIEVRPSAEASVRRLQVARLDEALRAAEGQGCAPL